MISKNHYESDVLAAIRYLSINTCSFPLKTVGLLVALFKTVYSRSNADSLKILSGFGAADAITLEYASMSLQAARRSIEMFVAGRTIAGATAEVYKTPLFVIDEAPALSETAQYKRCTLQRNLIRCMQCVCLVTGTNAAVIDATDHIPRSAHGDTKYEYMRLITRLPPTYWKIFANDAKYAALIASMPNDMRVMLQHTRPLFLEYVLDAMLEIRQPSVVIGGDSEPSWTSSSSSSANAPSLHGRVTEAVLSAAKNMIVQQTTHFASDGGLYAQMALVHLSVLQRTVDEVLVSPSTAQAGCTSDHHRNANALTVTLRGAAVMRVTANQTRCHGPPRSAGLYC